MLAILLLLAAGTGDVEQSACKPGGFKVLRFGSVEARGKAGASFNVQLDANNYQGNGFDAASRSAMATWSVVSGSNWRYVFSGYAAGASSSDGQMTVQKGGTSFPQGVLAATLVSADSSTGQIVDSDTFFNPAVSFSAGSPGPGEFDFQSVALHEMGHGLGLDHNDGCYPSPTVMQSAIAAGAERRILFPPEIEGVRFLYPGTGPGGGGGGGGGITAAPSSVPLSGVEGGSPPAPQMVVISVGAGAAWSASWSVPWLTISPSSGGGPSLVTVAAATGGLAAGFYTGKITFTSGGVTSEVSVSLSLAGVEVSPATLSFTALAGGAAPDPKNVTISGAAGLAWSATASTSSGGNWLRLSSSSGGLPAVVAVFASAAGLAANVYAGKLTFGVGGAIREVPVQLTVTGQPQLVVDPAQLTLSSPTGNPVPVCVPITVRSSGGDAFDWTGTSGASWLAVQPGSGRAPASASVCVTAGSLAPRSYLSRVTIAAPPYSPQSVAVTFVVTPAVSVSNGGVRNAASFAPEQPVAAGEILSIFGVNLAGATASANAFPLPTDLADCRVLMGGVPARLLYVSPSQVNLIAPSVLADVAGSATTLTIFNGRQASPAARVAVARQAPGVFTVLGNGSGAGAVTHADGSLVSRASPLAPREAFSVYMTGMGPLDLAVPEGDAAPADPLARAASPVRLLVDGQEAAVLFAGASPGFAGLQVVVATAPASLARRYPEMVVEVQGAASNRFTAGGPSLLDVTPGSVHAGTDATVTLRGIYLSPTSAVTAGGATLPADFTDGDLQTLRVTIPARLLSSPGTLALAAVDSEAASNTVTLAVDSKQ
ncbi:MAG: matrixin family metalloprotease [Acidobacteria bacterium]|nr:matrixin family metalloprotease [Acidobacteriota bacterium]